MKSQKTVILRNLADVELAYRRLRDDIVSLETSGSGDSETTSLIHSMRRLLVQAVLSDRYIGTYIKGDLETAKAISYTPVSTLADLHTIVRGNLKGKFQLTADIDATADCLIGGAYYNGGEGWQPIGTIDGGEGGNPDSGFQGIFDGNNHKITGLKIVRADEDYQGFFGFIGQGGIVKNLILEDVDVSGRSCIGGLCGGNYGTVFNCHTTGSSSVQGNCTDITYTGNVGGLVGDNDGWLNLCSTAGEVHGLRDVGGLAGDNDKTITSSYSTADVYGSHIADIGGLVGDNKGFIEYVPMSEISEEKASIFNCFATGTVQSRDDETPGSPAAAGDIGGLVGDNRGGKISLSYATGAVSGKQPDIGGFVGSNKLGDNSIAETKDSMISNCYCTGNVTPLGNLPLEGSAGGFVGDNKGGQVYNCYCANQVTHTEGVNDREDYGDFCGDNSSPVLLGTVYLCFYNETLALIGLSDGGEPKTTAELQEQVTFEDWNFDTVWSIEEGISYPTLPDIPAAEDADADYVSVYPVERAGTRPLTGDVRPKIIPGMIILAVKCEDDIDYTPFVVEDLNFPVGRGDIEAGAVGKDALGDANGNDILGAALGWDENENIDVLVNDTNIHINDDNQLAVVDNSIGKEKLGDIDGNNILGVGLGWNDETEKIDVDLTELSATDFDLTSVADEITIGFDNPVAYIADKIYSADQKVSSGGMNYKSLQDANTGNTPATSPTWWESIGSQNVLRIETDAVGDGLSWSSKGKIQVNQGDGLDINEGGELIVDLHEVIDIDKDALEADSTDQTNNDWYTVLTKQITAAIGKNLDIRLFMPVKSSDIGIGDKRGKFNVRVCIGTSGDVGTTIVEGRYELPDHGDQIPVSMCPIIEDIEAADPYIRVQLKNDDYTINQTHIDCATYDGQFAIIVF